MNKPERIKLPEYISQGDSINSVRLYGKEMVRVISEEIYIFGDVLKPVIQDIYNAMIHFNGLGLAAPQLHIFKRIFIIGNANSYEVFINPKIIGRSNETTELQEGCLSIPGASARVSRRKTCVLEYQDIEGNIKHLEMRGMASIAAQHELDHLDGKFYVDHLKPMKRKLIIDKLNRQINAYKKALKNGTLKYGHSQV